MSALSTVMSTGQLGSELTESGPQERAVGVATCPTPAPVPSRPLAGPTGDVLTWRLARRVMVDHEFDVAAGTGDCKCCGEPWPCGAWRRAEDIANQFKP